MQFRQSWTSWRSEARSCRYELGYLLFVTALYVNNQIRECQWHLAIIPPERR